MKHTPDRGDSSWKELLGTAALSGAVAVLIVRNFFETEKKIKCPIRADYAAVDDVLVRTMGQLLGPPLPGNKITILKNGDGIFPAMLAGIRSAKRTITFESPCRYPPVDPRSARMKSLAVLLLLSATAMAADLHPIVEMDTGYLFGGSADGKWIKAEKAAKSMKGRTPLRVFGLTREIGKATGGKPKSVEEVCPDTLTVSLSSKSKDGVIALSAPWNALPRKPQIADPTQQVYVDAVRDFLKDRRISDPKVKITRILRVDLDGDGEEEVLINATNYFTKDNDVPMEAPAHGSYSIVLLRRAVAGKVQTELVAGEVYAKDKSTTPNVYKAPAVLDLNGDGKLEVIVHSQYYEGAATTIYDCSGGKCKAALSVECGL